LVLSEQQVLNSLRSAAIAANSAASLLSDAAAAAPSRPPQSEYLGDSAETAETAAIDFELAIPATTPWAATLRAIAYAATILTQSTIQCITSSNHIPAPSPLAQASVRSPLTLQKERTRKLQVHMGLAASTTARISSGSK
jgi:hypothetical protein